MIVIDVYLDWEILFPKYTGVACTKIRVYSSMLSYCKQSKDNYHFVHVQVLQCVSQTFDKWFPKFATNLAVSLCTCQSNCELGYQVVNFTPNFVGKLTSSL